MLASTTRLRKQLLAMQNQRERLRLLRNKSRDQQAILLGCGSSLRQLQPKHLARMQQGPVLAVKHAYIPFAGQVDYHLTSKYKFVNYVYGKKRPIVLAFQQPGKYYRGYSDILMPLQHGGDFHNSITATQTFDRWRMDRSFERCCGPGIVYELGFYLAVHLGVKEILTVGVDFDGGDHFYIDQPAITKQIKTKRKGLHGKRAELDLMVAGIPLWNQWLTKQGVLWKFLDVGQDTPLRNYLPGIKP